MKAIFLPLVWAGLALASVTASAQTAHARGIMGFDHIASQQVGKVLVAFCKKNGCRANVHTWQLTVGNTTPVSVGGGCRRAGINYDFCVGVWGKEGMTFMNPARTQQLKAMLEAKGAKVTLMDCSFEVGNSFGHYVCADGKPLP